MCNELCVLNKGKSQCVTTHLECKLLYARHSLCAKLYNECKCVNGRLLFLLVHSIYMEALIYYEFVGICNKNGKLIQELQLRTKPVVVYYSCTKL